MEIKSLSFAGSEIVYRVSGPAGTPVLMLVHGFGEDGDIWVKQVPEFTGKWRVLVPDLPGSGLSPFNAAVTDMHEMAEALRIILLSEETGTTIVLGHSMGGYITLALAEKNAELLAGFGLVHSTAYADSEEKKATRRKGIAFMEECGAEPFLRISIPNLFTKNFVQQCGEQVNGLLEKSARFTAPVLAAYYNGMINRPDRSHVLKDAQVPVFFAAGRHDEAVPCRHSLEQCHLPVKSYIHVLENSAHMGMWEEPGTLNRSIHHFLNWLY